MTNINKKQKKRWEKKFIDKRDWHSYNEQLVRQGEYLLDLDFVEGWDHELASMNAGKHGAPYQFPDSLIELQAIWHAKRIGYRMIEGMTRDLRKIGQLPDYNDYSTVNRRVNKLAFTLAPPQGENIVVFSDGTGMQAVAGGEYLREKYGKKNRRWVQLIILGDAKTKCLSSQQAVTVAWTLSTCGNSVMSKASHRSSNLTRTHEPTPTQSFATRQSKSATG